MHRAAQRSGSPTRCLAVAVLALFLAAPAFAQGTARSLDIQPGARQNGMGCAGVALLGTPSDALWWNPALLGLAHDVSVQGTYANLLPNLADIPYYHLAAAVPAGPLGVGVSYTRLDYDFGDAFESTPAVALGLRILPGVAIGGTVKWVKVQFSPFFGTGTTNGYDVGAVARIPVDRGTLGFGINWQNFGGEISFLNEDAASPLSENIKVGGAYEVGYEVAPDATLGYALAADYNDSQVTDGFNTWHVGFEVSMTQRDLMRVAGRLGWYDDDLGNIQDFTFGAGVRVWKVGFDVAWFPQSSDLDRVIKMTAGLSVPFPAHGRDDDDTEMASRVPSRRSR